jgi:hypothetical protein
MELDYINKDSEINNIEIFAPIIKNWRMVIDRYIKIHGNEDNPYWWNERANIGLLAAAAYATEGFCSLEEYQYEKGKSEEEQSVTKTVYAGRNDLYIANKDNEFYFEAKVCWPLIDDLKATAQKKFKEAMNSASQLPPVNNTSEHNIALTFVVPYIEKNAITNEDREKLSDFLEYLKSENTDLYAVYLNEGKLPIARNEKHTPAVIMVMQKVSF